MITLNRIIRLLPLLVLMMAAPICVSQVSEGPQTASAAHAVGGQVVNSVTGEPIARARVQVGQQATLTDHDGRFEFDNVSEEAAYASASKPGYFAEDRLVPAQGQSIPLRLIPEAILFGTITDENGQPIQDLKVQLSMLQVHHGLRRWQPMQTTSTSVDGKFRFAELQAGQYSLATVYHIEGLREATSSLAFMPVTFPAPAEDGIRGALTLAPGDQVEANASPATQKLYPVSGVINRMSGLATGFVETQNGEVIDSASLKWSASSGDDGGSNQAFVALIPLDNLTQPSAEYIPAFAVFSDHKPSPDSPAEGGFVGLAPGRYLVLALSHQQELPYRDHDVLQRYMSLGQEVTLTRGGKAEIQLKIMTGEP